MHISNPDKSVVHPTHKHDSNNDDDDDCISNLTSDNIPVEREEELEDDDCTETVNIEEEEELKDHCISTVTENSETENIEEEDEELKDDCTSALTEITETDKFESAIDATGKTLDLQVLDGDNDTIEGLYVYKNIFNLIPRSVGGLSKLKTLKFFGNEVNLFPSEFGNLVDLERLHVKISLPGLTGLPLQKLKALKELELSTAPARPSAFPLLADIMGLVCLTKLSVCHFSIRLLPPEIGCLTCLEYLDLSHNKMKNLPTEISSLCALLTLKVANNKLVQVPSLSSLQRLENLDLSNNRLTSLSSIALDKMAKLQRLNLQHNKLSSSIQLPLGTKCDLEGNDEVMTNDDSFSSPVEMDVLESTDTNLHDDSINGPPALSTFSTGSSSSRYILARKPRKGWKRRYHLQQRARQGRLSYGRKLRGDDSTQSTRRNCDSCDDVIPSESILEGSSINVDADLDNEELAEDGAKHVDAHGSGCVVVESIKGKNVKDDCIKHNAALGSLLDPIKAEDEHLLVDKFCGNKHSRRYSESIKKTEHPKKRRLIEQCLDMSHKYSTMSFCSIDDHLPDGFYDAGRDRPFLPLIRYENNLHIGSREVIVMDRERDEELDAVTLCAKTLLSHLNHNHGFNKDEGDNCLNSLQIAYMLAQFVSDHFGGSDRSTMVDRARKSASGSSYNKPFICTCPTGNNDNILKPAKHSINTLEDAVLFGLCEKSLQLLKARRNSNIVPIGSLQFGVCRHRALLMKYLCDRVKPRVPCELVRGYLDFAPHAWNVVIVKRGDSEIRMVVDACRPHDIREEMDPEYFHRYIPLNRINFDASPDVDSSFPVLSARDQIEEGGSATLIRCNLNSNEAVAKVHTLEVNGSSINEVRNFEFKCLGEVRLLSVFNHPCIVNILGHQISNKWLPSQNGAPEHRILQSAIFMEHVKGGSLKHYLEKLARSGEKHVPLELALQISKDIAWALSEVHSKDVIHRDLKSANILIDLVEESDGTPIVKLCDFDRAVPLRSPLHTCCIGHMGVHPPNVCVGTPRWMAPEVYRTMHDPRLYGLEVDVWSFGCLILELLTLQVPYAELPESEIHNLLSMGKRPLLTDELEAMGPAEDTQVTISQSKTEEYKKEKMLRFLIDIYRQCTKEDPNDRPTAEKLYHILRDFSSSSSAQV
ncbi:uncharacterized protein [Rutidosis leptorrhynchoides]|uniref:uncharacterized protein n=1 Tax=Rutidosis leptorrhynchoides TaxID=125765 RepID=UPI003A9900D6